MKISFRQGVVSYQAGGFLQLNGNDVDILAANKPLTVTIAHRTTNYTHSEDNSIPAAWVGPFSEPNYYLYCDFNPLTFERTFGKTNLPPVAQSVAPGSGNRAIVGVVLGISSPAFGSFEVSGHYVLATNRQFDVVGSTGNDGTYTVQSATYNIGAGTTTIIVNEVISDGTIDGQLTLDYDAFGNPLYTTGRTWFDTVNNIHYILDGTAWREILRVYAARLYNGTTFATLSQTANFAGSQIGNSSITSSGRVLFAEYSASPMRRTDGTFFTTEDQFFVNQSRVDAVRLESNVSYAQSTGTVGAFHVVAWSGDSKITSAVYEDTGNTVVGIVTENLSQYQVGSVITQGTITNPLWSWTEGTGAVAVGSKLWIANDGSLTPIDPHVSNPVGNPAKQVPVARVLGSDTIIFEQGLGGVGPQGPTGTVTALTYAGYNAFGVTSLSHPPTDGIPIAVGINHPVITAGVSGWATLNHTHTAEDISYVPGNGIASSTTQSAINELALEKLNLSGGVMTGTLEISASSSTQLVLPNYTTMGLPPVALEGGLVYDTTNKALSYYNGSAWVGTSTNEIATSYGTTGEIDLDLSTNTYFYPTGTTTGTITFVFNSPAVAGIVTAFTLELLGAGDFPPNWPVSVIWQDGTVPTWTSGGIDVVGFITRDGGASYMAMLGGTAFG